MRYLHLHALFRLIQSWQKELDELGFLGTKLMDLSKGCDCLPHDLMAAKLEAYDLAKECLQLISDYLSCKLFIHLRNNNSKRSTGSEYSINLDFNEKSKPLHKTGFFVINKFIQKS